MTAITRPIAEFAAAIDFRRLPTAVAERAKTLVIDQVGICVRARNEAQLCPSMEAAIRQLGLGNGAASVIGDRDSYSPAAAALFNGNLGHSLDFDDTHAASSLHPSAPIVPAAFAAAEMAGAAGADFIAGLVAGFEIQIRLSLALDPTAHYDQGFHPTATCGVFGAAAAAGRVLGLSADKIQSALGLCGSLAAGSMQFLADGAWNKPFHTGYAAMNGLFAATLAGEGFRGTDQAIEGKSGFLHGYAPAANPERAAAGIGETWETLGIAIKPYPSCRYSHAAMDALIAIRNEHSIDTADVELIEIGLPRTGWKIIGDPEEEKQQPANYVDGQFSMPFCAAVVLRDGAMNWDSYSRHLGDPATLALCRRVHTSVHDRPEADFPRYLAGQARVTTKRGTHEKYVAVAKGEPENFLSMDELRVKFDGLVGPYLEANRREEIWHALLALETATDVGAILRLTRPDAG